MAFVRACALSEVPTDEALGVSVEGVDLAIARDGEEFFALRDECSHAAVPLSEGEVADGTVECWLHGSTFDLRNGKPTCLPATEPVATFGVDVRGDDLFVDVSTTLNGVSAS